VSKQANNHLIAVAGSLILGVLPGIAGLSFAAKHKPTLSNLIANGGDVLTPSTYHALHTVALLLLIGGILLTLVSGLRMASRPRPAAVAQYAPPAADTRER
jgi:uncharacterized membrane protein YdjX (TVP38/TMEM64 family)